MPFPVLVPAAEADIDEALQNTLAKWGERKLEEYIALIEEALVRLTEDPRAGKRRPDVDEGAWTYNLRPVARFDGPPGGVQLLLSRKRLSELGIHESRRG